ncbi:hypothetical protein HDU98_006301 [Podochytrium sp. JEL0797]|nr:hypothetical protein HDU98_006301 [Podochytrium sp. JEL0797]
MLLHQCLMPLVVPNRDRQVKQLKGGDTADPEGVLDETGKRLSEMEAHRAIQQGKREFTEVKLQIALRTHSPADLAALCAVSKAWRQACLDDVPWRRFLRLFSVPNDCASSDPPIPAFIRFATHARLFHGLLLEYSEMAPQAASLALSLGMNFKPDSNRNSRIRDLFDFDEWIDIDADETAAYYALTELSVDNSDMLEPSRAWRPQWLCTRSEKLLILLYHIYTHTASVQIQDQCIGIFGTNQCYDDIYAMHLLPLERARHLRLRPNHWIPHQDRIKTMLRFGTCQLGEGLALVTSGELSGHVIRFARASTDFDRMGPIPKRHMPFFDLGMFETWFSDFLKSLSEGKRRIVGVQGRGGREMNLPSIFLDEGQGTGVAVTHEENPKFDYCSYSDGGRVEDLDIPVVSLEGWFTFVPGGIETPIGESFEVQIPFVQFERPESILVQ